MYSIVYTSNETLSKEKIIIILAWRFKGNILPKIAKYGSKYIVIPLPEFQEVSLWDII